MTLVALSSEPHLGHSEPSDVLTVSTFPSFEGHSNESNFQGEFSRNKHGKRSGVDEERNDDNEDVDEDDRSEEMSLKVLQNESNLIELSWRGCKLPSEAAFLKIKWKLFGQKNVNFICTFIIFLIRLIKIKKHFIVQMTVNFLAKQA